MISTIKEDNLTGKSYFEIWDDTFGFKVEDIMHTMEYFLNNLSDQQSRMIIIV